MAQKKGQSTLLIRFHDCDPFNHLNNGRYIDYFMNAREDHLTETFNFNIYKHAMKTGESWVVLQNQIAYLAPALLNEKVIIQSHLIEWSDKTGTVEMQMWDESKKVLKSLLWSKSVHFNLKTQQAISHGDDIKAKFNITDAVHTVDFSFDERIVQIKKEGFQEA